MNSSKLQLERSKIIPIYQKSPTNMKEINIKEINMKENEYSLQQHFFDPSKSSPPNEFMLKLRMRMTYYNSFLPCNNLDNLINK
jgi:hypothetical protein